jgi:hypothetical protein
MPVIPATWEAEAEGSKIWSAWATLPKGDKKKKEEKKENMRAGDVA